MKFNGIFPFAFYDFFCDENDNGEGHLKIKCFENSKTSDINALESP